MTDALPTTDSVTPSAPENPPKRTGKRPTAPRPQAPRTVSPVLERLFELYPKMFGAQFLPLKLGVFQDLLERHPEEFKKDELKLAMGQHARSTRYLESVAAGHARHDLDGNPVEPVAPEHVHHAILEVFRRRQARSREDLRPRLRLRLMEAIEASGLTLEAYAERVRVQDETANALLDEAMTQLKLEAAKRDALMAAFKASGRSEAEFADMYGMKLAEVKAVLERVRRYQDAAKNASE
jgi:ProP effector